MFILVHYPWLTLVCSMFVKMNKKSVAHQGSYITNLKYLGLLDIKQINVKTTMTSLYNTHSDIK